MSSRRPKFAQRHAAYLSSPEWAAKRVEAFAQLGAFCAKCGALNALHVHHLTYAHLGDEPIEDLIVLCDVCHRLVHQIHDSYKGYGKPSLADSTLAVIDGRLPPTGPEYGQIRRR